ncbi:MAG TPA: sulfotransferase domain-containing protein [Thermoanaerobaculia bacterium]|nr:sulfotransferase domain-containing protein [Thermoanaerobaculia bacterium]
MAGTLGGIGNWAMAVSQGLSQAVLYKFSYTPRPEDVFIATAPKSGTTLLQMMLYQLTTDGAMSFPHIDSVSPFYELDFLRGAPPGFHDRLPSPRIFKTHLRYENLPPGVPRVLYMVRDVWDVVLSSYHHECLVTGMDLNLEMFIDRYLARQTRFVPWFEHMRSWWPHRDDSNVLFLRYEEAIADLEGTVRKVAAFCGIPIDETQMPRIVERCGLEFMKRHNEKFDPRLRRVQGEPGTFIREGKAGKGRQALSERQQQEIARRLDALAQQLGQNPGELRGSS